MPHVFIANVYFAPHSYGGATVVAEQVARHLARDHGWEVTAVSTMCDAALPPYHLTKAEAGGIRSYLINLPPTRSYAESYDNGAVTEVFARLLDLHQPDVLHAHCIQDLGVGLIAAAQGRGIRTVVSVHDFWWLCERQFMIRADGQYCGLDPISEAGCKRCVANISSARTRRNRLGQTLANADLVTYPSDFARALSARSGFGGVHHVVWRNGVTPPAPDFFARQSARRRSDPRLAFGFVGGPSEIKGWPQLQGAFKSVEQQDFVVHVVDASLDGTWWRPEMFSDLSGNWRVHPRYTQENLDDFFAQIDVLLFPSQWKETFGLAIREAVGRGIKVIQTDSGGTVEHDQVGSLLPLGKDASPLRAAVVQSLADGVRGLPRPLPQRTYSDQAREFVGLSGLARAAPLKAIG